MTTMKTDAPSTALSPIEQLRSERLKLLEMVNHMSASHFIRAHAALIDDYFQSGFASSTVGRQMGLINNPYTLIALGGYGRAEQCVLSDIDLLFLFETRVPAEAEALVREIIYPLWDIGLEVGHATRSIKECLHLARSDFETLTALLDSRFICGMSPLYHRLMEQIRNKLINLKPNKIISWLIQTNRTRHERFGDGSYLLEPNLKEGQGGLRDYHTILWISRIQSNVKLARDLEYYGYLSHDEFQTLREALDFVWRVRNGLHLMVGRKCDQLHLEHQTRLALAMGVEARQGHLPVEELLGRLHGNMEFIKQCYRVFVYELDQRKRMRRKNRSLKTTTEPGLRFNRGMLHFNSPEAVLNNPALLISIFVEAVLHKAPLAAEARRLVKEFNDVVGQPEFRNDPTIVADFEKVLMRASGTFDVLNAMLDTGFLVHFIPEFKGVVNRIQFDQYHLYPVARHLLRTVRMLKHIIAGKTAEQDPLVRSLYKEIRSKKALFWSALLHDIGKADPRTGHAERGAAMSQRILADKGLAPADVHTVVFLVKEHLLFFETATRRDISDEETALFVARRIGKPDRLKMLYLLSIADAMATGPKAWNDWTASLMRSLFLKSLNAFSRGELVSRQAVRIIEEKKEHVLNTCRTKTEHRADHELIKYMSPRYLLNVAARQIPSHISLFRALGDRGFVWRIDKSPDGRTRTVTLCAKDRPGLLSKVAGVLTLNSIDILDVRIFTWRNNIALDIFEVKAPPDPIFEKEHWRRTAAALEEALAGTLDLAAALELRQWRFRSIQPFTKDRPQKVIIDNEASSFFTIIEVIAWDFPGLLYRITDALFRCRLDIWVAKIATRVDQVVDVFYVRTFDGEKIDFSEEEDNVRKTIEAVLR